MEKREIESKFLIIGSDTKGIVEKLSTRKKLSRYTLGEPIREFHHDIYFDNSKRDLRREGGSLRIRRVVSGGTFATLKLKSKAILNQRVHERIEIEGLLNENDTIERIWKALNERGFINGENSCVSEDLELIGPIGVFERWGFVQAIEFPVNRITRNVCDSRGETVAELCLDNIRYVYEEHSKDVFEIELESRTGTTDVIEKLGDDLHRLFPNALESSKISKYARGLEFLRSTVEHKIEIKFSIPTESAFVTIKERLKRDQRITGRIKLDHPSYEFQHEDIYYDTEDFALCTANCYLRIREEKSGKTLTFRKHEFALSTPMIDQKQIKRPLSKEALAEAADYLEKSKIIPPLGSGAIDSIDALFGRMKLQPRIRIATERTAFYMFDGPYYQGNIKCDRVVFIPLGEGKRKCHFELELSAVSKENETCILAVAFTLLTEFGRDGELRQINIPKYATGLSALGRISDKTTSPENTWQSHFLPLHRHGFRDDPNTPDAKSSQGASAQVNVESLDSAPGSFIGPTDAVPEDLRRSIKEGKCILFLGAGASLGAKDRAGMRLPSWKGMVDELVDKLKAESPMSHSITEEIGDLLRREDLLTLAEWIDATLSPNSFQKYVKDRLGTAGQSQVHDILSRKQFAAVITTNYDNLAEDYWKASGKPTLTLTPHEPARINMARLALEEATRAHTPIIKLHGTWEDPNSLVFGPRAYREIMYKNEAFRHFMAYLFTKFTVVFVGFSFRDPNFESLLKWIYTTNNGNLPLHYCFLENRGEVFRRYLKEHLSVRLISYPVPPQGHSALLPLLSSL